MEFTDQTIIVTGAGYGIGKQIALAFGRQGGNVVLAARSKDKLDAVAAELRAFGTRPLVVPTDVASEAAVRQLIDTTMTTYGRLDVLVSNAGIAGPTALARDVTAEAWCQTIAINLHGAFYGAKYASAVMIEAGRGVIIHIASVAGRIGFPLRTPYAASKWGMIGLSHSLAAELGPYGIRVNTVVPGPIAGQRMHAVIAARAEVEGRSFADVEQEIVQAIPLRRMPTEAEVASAVLYLASEAASGIHGQTLQVDGGFRMQ